MLSFSGIVTFKSAADVRAAAAACPLDRLLVETDSPYLAPVPYRGRRQQPGPGAGRRRRRGGRAGRGARGGRAGHLGQHAAGRCADCRRTPADRLSDQAAAVSDQAADRPAEPAGDAVPRQISDLLTTHGLRPSRALGQNFVTDANTVRRIVRLAGVGPGDRVLEIGPGLGSLTLALEEAGAAITAVEVDRRLLPVLEAVLGAGQRPGPARRRHENGLGGGARTEPGWVMVANLPVQHRHPAGRRPPGRGARRSNGW